MFHTVNLPISEINTEILRNYLANYKSNSKASMVTINNIRRTLSSLFAWLENEDYIVKSPREVSITMKKNKRELYPSYFFYSNKCFNIIFILKDGLITLYDKTDPSFFILSKSSKASSIVLKTHGQI